MGVGDACINEKIDGLTLPDVWILDGMEKEYFFSSTRFHVYRRCHG